MEYTCRICGRSHQIYFGVKGGESSEISRLKEEAVESVDYLKEEGVYLINDALVVVPAVLLIPTAYDTPLWFVTWIELEKSVYKLQQHVTQTQDLPVPIYCRLFDNLSPHYDQTKGLLCSIEHLPGGDHKPLITVLDDSLLKTNQSKGLSKGSLLRIMDRLHHGVEYQGRIGSNLEDIYLGSLAGRIDMKE